MGMPNVVEVLTTRWWIDYDIMGAAHVYAQHEGYPAFCFVTVNYNYAYTNNAHRKQVAEQVLAMLGGVDQGPPDGWESPTDKTFIAEAKAAAGEQEVRNDGIHTSS